MNDIEDLANEIERNNFMLAALHHKSARHGASEKLKEYDLDDRVLDAWESFGKSVIGLYSACRAVDIAEKSSGACSLAERKIRVCVYEQLGKKIKLTNKEKFGGGVGAHEKNSVEFNNSLTNQLVGAIQDKLGYARLKSDFIDKLLSLESIDIVPEKDSKTKLQEYCQSVRHKLPSYSLLGESGPPHSRRFQVKVEALGVKCEGMGSTKRLAELQAAQRLIEEHSVKVERKKKTCNANKQINYISAVKLMPPPTRFRKINLIVEKLKLPLWSAPLVGLALTHRSYRLVKVSSVLGKNNTVLAFLGASVIEWIAYDTAIRSFSLDDLSKAGGIREIVRVLVNESSVSKIFDELLLYDDLLLGPGEKELTQASKSEFIQALFAVLFLVEERALKCAKTLIEDIPIFLDHFISRPKSMELSRDLMAPIKSVFQEKCHLLGLKVKFQTDPFFYNQQKYLATKIMLDSSYLNGVLSIRQDEIISKDGERKQHGVLESDLARKNRNLFSAVLPDGLFPVFESSQIQYVKWVAEHSLRLARNSGEKSETLRISKLINKNFLGVKFVKNMVFSDFECFIGFISKFIDFDVDLNKKDLVRYYGHAGRSLASNKSRSLSKAINDLESVLFEADPLQESQDIRSENAFKNFISEATTYRLKSGDATLTSIGEIVEEFKLLRRSENKIICKANTCAEIFEVDGSHLCLLDTFKAFAPENDAVHIEIDIECGELCISAIGLTGAEQKEMLSWPTFFNLKVILAISKIVESQESIKIYISSLAKNPTRKISLEFWWQYHFKDPYEIATNDRIASILHDIKNSILGYCFTSEHAKNKSVGRERFLLAADASGHLDKAKVALRVVKSLSSEIGLAAVSKVKVTAFIKTLISELWSWTPSSVNLIFSPCDSSAEICTDEQRLRALISNLVKNSVEAMEGSGSIYISYSLEIELEGIEFVISDTGPGFQEEQLVSLEYGAPLKTSKGTGHGIGLMSVMLTAKELGGNIIFSNRENFGANVKVWIPSINKNE